MRITPNISIDDSELDCQFVRASGPGGQNVNKVATACQLRFNINASAALPATVKIRLKSLAGRRVTADGVLILDARRHRTQQRNRQDALDRFVELLQRAAVPPKSRKATRPSAASKHRRLETKRRRSLTKQLRRKPIE